MTLRISFGNEKGGVGKSTFSSLMAAMLAALGYRVILFDGDPQSNVTRFFGLTPQPDFYRFCTDSLTDLASNPVFRVVDKKRYTRTPDKAGQLMVVSGDITTKNLATLFDTTTKDESGKVKPVLDKMVLYNRMPLLDRFADYILFDTHPTASTLQFAIAAAAHRVIIPNVCEPFSSMQGLPDTVSHTRNVENLAEKGGVDAAKVTAIIPNLFQKGNAVHEQILAGLLRVYGEKVWEPVPISGKIPQSHLKGKTLNVLYPNTELTKQLWGYARRIEAMKNDNA